MCRLTNRRSRGPCKTDAVTVEVLMKEDVRIDSVSSSIVAEGAIVTAMSLAWGERGMPGYCCGPQGWTASRDPGIGGRGLGRMFLGKG